MRTPRWISLLLVAAMTFGMAATGWSLDGRTKSPRTLIPPEAELEAPAPNMSMAPTLAAPSAPVFGIGLNQRIINPSATCQRSEIGIGTSRNGQNIVVGANGDFVVSSQNFGATWSAQTAFPAGGGSSQGDPSVGFGRNGRAYLAFIWNNPAPSCDFGVSVSPDSGVTFPAPVSAVSCPPSGPGSGGPAARGCFPDQETIAVDQLNPGPTGGDQVYLAWRQFTNIGCNSTNATGNEDASITCSPSSSSAGSWLAPVLVDAAGDRPRPAVAPNGTVYVAYVLGDGGAAFFITPNAPADFENPYHVYLFEPDDLRQMLGRHFEDVTVLGLDGDAAVKADFERRRKFARTLLKLDPWGLRHKLPRSWFVGLHAFARRVTYPFLNRKAAEAPPITAEQFSITEMIDPTTLVLFAVAKRPKR